MTSPSPAIACCNLTLGYNRHPAVHHLSGAFMRGSLTAIVGPNGAGKSTLLRGMTGTLRPLDGEITITPNTCSIAYLPQISEIDRSFPISVYDLVAAGLWSTVGSLGSVPRSAHERIQAALATVGLSSFERRTLGTLSGGQMQRALFARLIVQDAEIILLDEPFNAIDSRTVHDLAHLIEHWHGEGRTVIAVLHDHHLVRRTFPETLLIARELVGWGPTMDVLSPENITKANGMFSAYDPQPHDCERAA